MVFQYCYFKLFNNFNYDFHFLNFGSSISFFVVFNIFICGFSIFLDRPSDISKFFTLLSFWNLPYRLFQFYTAGTGIVMTLPCFFYRSTAFFRPPYCGFFDRPYRVFFDHPTRSVDRLYFPWYEPIPKTNPPPKTFARKGIKTATGIPVGHIRSNHMTQKWTNTNSGPSEELKARIESL